MKTIKAGRRNKFFTIQNGYGIVETLIVIVIVSILVIFVMRHYEDTLLEARKTALENELINIRQSIVLFKITKGRYPDSLNELLTTNIMFQHSDPKEQVFKNKYLQHYAVDENNNILDPFGLSYLYNPATGKVKSQKKSFESW